MKKTLPWLLCLILMSDPLTNQIASANGIALSAGYISGVEIGSILNTRAASNINAADKTTGDSIVSITTTQPMLRCTGAIQNGFIAPNNCINLDSGNILISPDRDIAISTDKGTVSIASGATIFLMSSTKGMIIYDLQQTKPKQVSVVVNKHRLVMEPGRMLVLTRQKARSFEELEANCHRVSYRKPEEIELQGDDMTAFAAGFSISSALMKIMPLKQLINSSEKRDRILLDKLIKSAVILHT